MITYDGYKERMAEFVYKNRNERAMSKFALANAVGVDSKTLVAWESGNSIPDMYQFSSLCDIFGKNAVLEHCKIVHPEIFSNADPDTPLDSMERQLSEYIYSAPEFLVRELYYCCFSEHGSYFPAQIQFLVAMNHLPLQAKIILSRNLQMLFHMNEMINALRDKDKIMPDMDLLDSAILLAEEAVKNGKNHYTMNIKR